MKHLCDLLQIDLPIIQGGMGNISNAELATAVSEAGGLGTIGCGTMTPNEVEQMILQMKKLTKKNFAVNIAINVSPYTQELIDLIIKHDVPVVSLSAGNPFPYISVLQDHGIKVLVLVASVKHAEKAESAGADILVAEGFEAAGINSSLELTTFTLIPQIVKCVEIPVVAAGGIGDGKGLAAALMLGASGVQIGTRLIATQEAPFHEKYKQSLVNASDTETIIVGRSVGKLRRLLKTPFSRELDEREKEGLTPDQYGEMTSEMHHVKGAIEGDLENGFINSGQIAGLIDHIPSVKDLLESMMQDAKLQIDHTVRAFESMIKKENK
ncbi:NAD(P)H-dependent flavin oxidoreductase [Paenisporosarcina indica]|uniref:NAD(P)H-dependent flavin oxidoreductase n=1 Tax=Paenisporosarcina indica TaxID=650093 RepID=UPI00094FF129|nr:DUF561 domain-containing protein [Paenisporosarcina indica]